MLQADRLVLVSCHGLIIQIDSFFLCYTLQDRLCFKWLHLYSTAGHVGETGHRGGVICITDVLLHINGSYTLHLSQALSIISLGH